MKVREILSNRFGVVRVRIADTGGSTKESIVEQARVAASNASGAPVQFLCVVEGSDMMADILFGGPRP